MRITSTISRGARAGERLVPYRNRDGHYIVSETRFSDDYNLLLSLEEVADHVRAGFKLRMMPETGGPPSLISPKRILIEDP